MEESVIGGVNRGALRELFTADQQLTSASGCGNNWCDIIMRQ
jgi:hypothetical protein